MTEPDRDELIEIVARAIHGDDIDYDNLDDECRGELLGAAIDVLDALDAKGLTVVAKDAEVQP